MVYRPYLCPRSPLEKIAKLQPVDTVLEVEKDRMLQAGLQVHAVGGMDEEVDPSTLYPNIDFIIFYSIKFNSPRVNRMF